MRTDDVASERFTLLLDYENCHAILQVRGMNEVALKFVDRAGIEKIHYGLGLLLRHTKGHADAQEEA